MPWKFLSAKLASTKVAEEYNYNCGTLYEPRFGANIDGVLPMLPGVLPSLALGKAGKTRSKFGPKLQLCNTCCRSLRKLWYSPTSKRATSGRMEKQLSGILWRAWISLPKLAASRMPASSPNGHVPRSPAQPSGLGPIRLMSVATRPSLAHVCANLVDVSTLDKHWPIQCDRLPTHVCQTRPQLPRTRGKSSQV